MSRSSDEALSVALAGGLEVVVSLLKALDAKGVLSLVEARAVLLHEMDRLPNDRLVATPFELVVRRLDDEIGFYLDAEGV